MELTSHYFSFDSAVITLLELLASDLYLVCRQVGRVFGCRPTTQCCYCDKTTLVLWFTWHCLVVKLLLSNHAVTADLEKQRETSDSKKKTHVQLFYEHSRLIKTVRATIIMPRPHPLTRHTKSNFLGQRALSQHFVTHRLQRLNKQTAVRKGLRVIGIIVLTVSMNCCYELHNCFIASFATIIRWFIVTHTWEF